MAKAKPKKATAQEAETVTETKKTTPAKEAKTETTATSTESAPADEPKAKPKTETKVATAGGITEVKALLKKDGSLRVMYKKDGANHTINHGNCNGRDVVLVKKLIGAKPGEAIDVDFVTE